MEVLVILALVVGFAVCILPIIMSWHYHFGSKKTAEKKQEIYSYEN